MNKIKRLVYIFNGRLPTEKANGYQIGKMCEAFARKGIEVFLLHPYRRQTNPKLQNIDLFHFYGLLKNFSSRQIWNFDISSFERFFPSKFYQGILFSHYLIWGLFSVLTAHKLDADCYFTRSIQVAYWLSKKGMPTIIEIHGIPKRSQLWLLKRLIDQSAIKLVIALTSHIKSGLVDLGFRPEKVVVLHDGVDLSLFRDLPSKLDCRSRLGLPSKQVIIGYIGRFQALGMEKGVPELIQSMEKFETSLSPMLLCVGGPMEPVPAYLELARRYAVPTENLRFIDRVPPREVPYWMKACDVVTIPWTWNEFSAFYTSPLKLFEYMAAGIPIVASDLPSIREVIRHGENGWLVEPGNPDALAQGISYLIQDSELSERISRQAFEDVLNYSWENRVSKIHQGLSLSS